MRHEDHVQALDSALLRAVEKYAGGSFGILFSGGLDSSLIAKYCKDLGRRPILYSVGMPGSLDMEYTREAGSFFGFEHRFVVIEEDSLETLALRVMETTGDSSPLTVAIGIPLLAAMSRAREEGMDLLLCGQGADELFGGYHRYKDMDPGTLEAALREDSEGIYEKDLKRDLALAGACSIELGAPFLDPGVVEVAAGIPVSMKVREGRGKVILRELGRMRGLPESIYHRKKKALQYSTGVDRTLRRLAKRKGRYLGEYLADLGANRLK
jgi:asparagine synthase (glutamine-hydrolysing)